MSGDTPKLSTQTKTGDRIKLITDNAGKKVGDFVNPDTGEALRDLLGNVITGQNQMSVNQRYLSAVGDKKFDDLSRSEQNS
ncbi:hypothetical protein, partial [Klebsiella pneumoniae]